MYDCLILDDDRRTREVLARLVQGDGFHARLAEDLSSAREQIGQQMPDCAILDLDLPDGNGLSLLEELREAGNTEVLILTGQGTIDTAVEAIQGGVVDFLTKPVEPDRLQKALATVRRTLGLLKEVRKLRTELREQGRFAGMVGTSEAMQGVFNLIERVAPSSSSVLVLGETGAGKELVARAVHRLSKRAAGPFVAVNCGAIQESLVESELFGHEAGSFTGAGKRRRGYFEQAKGGTIFLDEVFEMPLEQQVNLLRVLESREILRVGGEDPVDIDVRVVAASNKRPEEVVQSKDLREDLLYRLMVFPIQVPPLRERTEDVAPLAQYFLDSLVRLNGTPKHFSMAALERLAAHHWPGNVRELRNIVERAYILGEESIEPDCVVFDQDALPGVAIPFGGGHPDASGANGAGLGIHAGMSIADAEKRLILSTLDALDGNKPKAAESLGISLKTLYNRLNVYNAAGST